MRYADERPHFVYLCAGERARRPHLKVGQTWNVGLRVRTLGYGKRKKPKLIGYIVCSNFWQSRKTESELLRKFHNGPIPRRKNCEWFEFDSAIVRSFFEQKGAVICG